MRISDWGSDVCSSDRLEALPDQAASVAAFAAAGVRATGSRVLRGTGIVEMIDGLEVAEDARAILTGGGLLVTVIGIDRRGRAGLEAGHIDPDQCLLFLGRPLLDREFERGAIVACNEAKVRAVGLHILEAERSEEDTSELQSLMT